MTVVGSYISGGHKETPERVRAAIDNLDSYMRVARTPEDKKELRKIIAALEKGLGESADEPEGEVLSEVSRRGRYRVPKSFEKAEYGDTITLKIGGKSFSFNRAMSGFYVYRGAFRWTKDIKGKALNPRPLRPAAAIALAHDSVAESADEPEGAELSESEKGSYGRYLVNADAAFLNAAAKKIKKLAGSRAERVEVKKGRTSAWIEYIGTDRSDFDLEWWAHVVMGREWPQVTVHIERKTIHGKHSREVKTTQGMLTVDEFVRYFAHDAGLLP